MHPDEASKSLWQHADDLWRESGIRWENPFSPAQEPRPGLAECPQPRSRPTTTFVIKNLPPGAPPYVATVAAATEPEGAYDYGIGGQRAEDDDYETYNDEGYDDQAYDDQEYDDAADHIYQTSHGDADRNWMSNRTTRLAPARHPRVSSARGRRVRQPSRNAATRAGSSYWC